VLAHEAFHCVQYWTWGSRWNLPYKFTEWWLEGTAEYFSNVVYPAADAEDDWLRDAAASSDPGLVSRDYDNVFFFQHIANEADGPAGAIAIIEATPEAGGFAEQLAALAALPEIEERFHEFARTYLNDQIEDLDEAAFPINPNYGPSITVDAVGEMAAFETTPFAVHRYVTNFVAEHEFVLSSGLEGEGQLASRVDLGAAWGSPPETATAACSDLPYVWLVTSTQGPVEHKSEVTAISDVECDRCLVGEWELDNATYEAYLPAREGLTFDGVSGRMWISYNDSGGFAGGFDEFTVAFSQETKNFDGSPVTQTVELRFDGSASGFYSAGGGVLVYPDAEYDFSSQVRVIFGEEVLATQDVPFSRRSFPIFEGVQLGYTCSDTELRYRSAVEGVDLEALVFRRTSPPPASP
jgi:hypothetical protein